MTVIKFPLEISFNSIQRVHFRILTHICPKNFNKRAHNLALILYKDMATLVRITLVSIGISYAQTMLISTLYQRSVLRIIEG